MRLDAPYMNMSRDSSSSTVLITGCSTGIGEACARELDRRGFRVFAGVRNEAAGERIRVGTSGRLTPVMLDVTNADQIAAAARVVEEATGEAGLDGLVNNAGIVVPGPLEALPLEAFRRQLEVNVVGQVAVTQAVLPLLRKARGRIVNMSSTSGGISSPCLGAYCASKWALEAINDALRQELRPWGMHVASVAPGPIKTPIWEKSAVTAEELAKGAPAEVLAMYEKFLAAMRRLVEESTRTAAPVERVVEAVVHALTATKPKTHYFIGWNARLSFKGAKMLPDRIRDWVVRKAVGLE
ncbi:MAG TPA: SDR family NAD(P)-dependent oxidoreductase [Thermoguttaceae bacterium]|nr:SDR family NAD(P)-dependent oxidoreductase [Thermoguttaceae bacterium]